MKIIILVILLAGVVADKVADDGYCEMNDEGTACIGDEDQNKYAESAQDTVESAKKEPGLSKEKLRLLEEEKRLAKEEIDNEMPNGLSRRDGVKTGHVEEVDVGEGKTVQVITRAMRPLLFEIPNLLSDAECDHIIKRAIDPKEGGMFVSKAKGGLTPKDPIFIPTGEKGKVDGWFGKFKSWDKNQNQIVDTSEVISIIHVTFSLWMIEDDIDEMWKKNNFTGMEKGTMNEDVFDTLNTIGLREYILLLKKNDPRFKTRTSSQAWLNMEQWIDPLVHKIRERLVKLTGLHRKIIYGGEMLQVLNYQPKGHYHAHHDSETHKRNDLPCCHQYKGDVIDSVNECKLCRYVTFVLYLNDVKAGGGTAFPIADNATLDEKKMVQYGNVSTDKYNLSHGCKLANLVLKPKKGMAVLWYNHLRNETDGWMGELDWMSLHGGCDVIEGEKWIANMWIPAPFGKSRHLHSIYLNMVDYEVAMLNSIA